MLRLWLYLAGIEASTSNYKSAEEVHAALVIPGIHEVIVVMSGVFFFSFNDGGDEDFSSTILII